MDLPDVDPNIVRNDLLSLGLQAINNLLAWDREKEMDLDNKPKLMFSDECQNLISCMQAYQPSAGLKCPSKDFVDNARYFCIGNFEYFSEDELISTGGGGY